MMKRKFPKIIYFLVCFLLIFEQSGFAQVAGQLDISEYFSGLSSALSLDKFRPLHLRYLSYDNLNNSFNLLLDKGDSKDLKEANLQDSTKELLNYFFTGITLANESFWVNLRPDSPDNMIDPYLAQTDLGKILLEADLQLKKDTASFTSPQTREGKQYWDKLYKKAGELFGSENITIPTLTRPWIVPGEIIIRESTDNAYIYKATLKVMLEQDYLKDSAVYNFQDERLKQLNEYSSQLIRETIIPKLTKDVNSAKRYAPLRQAYYSLILAQWFKQKFYGKGGFYSFLINKNNLTGLTSKEPWSKTTYFQAYQKSFKEGEYNIKEQVYALGSPTIRSYMSGGIAWQDINKVSSPIMGTEKRNPFNNKLGKFIIAAFVAGAIIFPSSHNAAGAASFDTAANTAQISTPAASANLELQRAPIPIVAKSAPATGVSGLGEIGTDLASMRTILNDLAAAGIKHIEPRLLLKYINIANDASIRGKTEKAYNLLRTKGVYSGPLYRVLFVQDLNNQVIVLGKSGVVVLDLLLLREQSQIKELPVLLSAGASFLSDKSPLLERHLNAQKKKMEAMRALGIPPRYQTGINKAFEAIYARAGSLAQVLAIDNKEQFLNNTIIMNIAVKEMDLTRLTQDNRLRVILKIWHPSARKYFEYPVFIHPNGSVEGGKIEERKEDLSPTGWVPVLSESKENIIYSSSATLPASSSPVSVSRRNFLKTAVVAAVVAPLVSPSIVNAAEKAAVDAVINYLASRGTGGIKITTAGNRTWDNYFNEYEILPGGSVKAETLPGGEIRITGSKAKMLVNEVIDFTGLEIKGDFEIIAEVYSKEGSGRYLRLKRINLSGENSGIYYQDFKAESLNDKKLSVIFNSRLVAPVMSAKELKDSLKAQNGALESTEESLRKAQEFNNIPKNKQPDRYNLQGEQLFVGFSYKQSEYNSEVWVERDDLQAYINFLTHKINGHKETIATLQKNLAEMNDSLRRVNTINKKDSGVLVLGEVFDGRPKSYNGQGPFYLNGNILRPGEVKGTKEINNLKPDYERLDISQVTEEVFPVRLLSLFQDLNLREAAISLQEEKLSKAYPSNISAGTVFAACAPEESRMSKVYNDYVNLFGTHRQYLQQLYGFALTNPVFGHLLRSTAGMDLDNVDKDGVPISFKGKPFTNLDRSFEKARQNNTFLFYIPKGGFYYPLFSSQRQMLNFALRLANSERNIEVIEEFRMAQKQGDLYETAAEYLRKTIIRQMAHEFVHFLQDQKMSEPQLQTAIQGLKDRFPDLMERLNKRYGTQSYISALFGGLSGDKLEIIPKEVIAFLIAELASDRPGFLLSDKNQEYVERVINFLQSQKLLPENFKLPPGYFNKASSPMVVGFECSNINTHIAASSAIQVNPVASSPVIYRGVEDMVDNLPDKIGADSAPTRDLIDWLQKVYGLHDGLLSRFYHNQGHNLGTANVFSYFLKNLGATDRDTNLAILAALMHDFHSRVPEGDKGVPAYVLETLLQLRDLMGIEDYLGPAKEKISTSYKEKISEDLKNEFRQALSKLFPGEKTGDLYNEIKAMIMRTDYASDIAAPKEYYKNEAAKIRQQMDTYLNKLKEWVSLDEAMGIINSGYKTLEEKATLEQDEIASVWLKRQKGIELGYLNALDAIKAPEKRKLIHDMSLLLEIADQTSFYVLLTAMAVENDIILGLQQEGVMASPKGSYVFFFAPQFLENPGVLTALKTLPMEYRENFVNTMEHFAGLGNALVHWNASKKNVYDKLGFQSASSPVVLGSRFDGQHGWVSKPEYLSWLQRIKELIRTKIGSATPVRVYYYGMGGGRSLNTGGVEPIDVISPLLATDFDQLYSYDYSEAVSLPVFKAVLNRQLSDLGIQDSDVRLEKMGSTFQFSFPYGGRQRTVIVTYGKDAKNEFPSELLSGFEVLYSRGIPVVFRDMQAATKTALLEQLKKQAGFLVMESFVDAPVGIAGFSRVDMGDTSWAGEARRLDVFQVPGIPTSSIEPASSPVTMEQIGNKIAENSEKVLVDVLTTLDENGERQGRTVWHEFDARLLSNLFGIKDEQSRRQLQASVKNGSISNIERFKDIVNNLMNDPESALSALRTYIANIDNLDSLRKEDGMKTAYQARIKIAKKLEEALVPLAWISMVERYKSISEINTRGQIEMKFEPNELLYVRQALELSPGLDAGILESSSILLIQVEPVEGAASPITADAKGGIDFRALPVITQLVNPITNLRDNPLRGQSLLNINLDESWGQIQNMLKAEIIPSSERIKEYLQACCEKKDMDQEIDKVLACIADILRLQEERVASTDLSLKEMLTLLESDKPANEMQLVLAKITVQEKEPRVLEQ